MTSEPVVAKYSPLARWLHWGMALLIATQFTTIFYVFIQGEKDPATLTMIQTHHASGMLILSQTRLPTQS